MIIKLNMLRIFEKEPATIVKKQLLAMQYVKHESILPSLDKKELDKSKLNMLA